MSDLIDRQAAIDAILHITNCKSVRELFEYNQLHHLTEMWSGGVNDAIDAVIGVDSAQLGTDLAEVGTRVVRGYPIDADALMEKVAEEYGERARNRLYQIIRYMPPAQPEQHLDEWCTDCKEYDTERNCCPRWNRVIRKAIADAQPEPRIDADGTLWVTVTDIEKVTRVIVDEDKSKFCRQFYMDALKEGEV